MIVPKASASQNRLRHARSEISRAWMIAPVRPKSRIRSMMPEMAVTIATRPKSSGASKRPSSTIAAIWMRVLPHMPPMVTAIPREARWARLPVCDGGALI